MASPMTEDARIQDQTLAGPGPAGKAMGRPLDGIRVLDFTQILAGPFCTRLLADLGADVLHVETASRRGRGAAPLASRESPAPGSGINRNKRSVTINLKTP